MIKLTLADVVRDLHFLEDHWTICAKTPWTPRSEACIARTPRDVQAADDREFNALCDVKTARRFVDAMEPTTWVSSLVDNAERAFHLACQRKRPTERRLSLVRAA